MRRRPANIRNTCRECGHTTVIVEGAEGRVVLDAELISVVTLDGDAKVPARRVHGERCMVYKLERERRAARQKLRG